MSSQAQTVKEPRGGTNKVKKVVNFLPPAYKEAGKQYRELVVVGVAVIVLLTAVLAVHAFRAAQADAYLRAAAQVPIAEEEYRAARDKLAALQSREKAVARNLAMISSWRDGGATRVLEAVEAVGSALPEGAWLTRLDMDEAGLVSMTGRASGWGVVARTLANLRRDPRFRDPVLTGGEGTGSGAAAGSAAADIVGFSVKLEYQGAAEGGAD